MDTKGKYLDRFAEGWLRGYEVGDGWIPIVDNALDRVAQIAPDFTLLQVKEKFGGLRIYLGHDAEFGNHGEQIRTIIGEAEGEAWVTCEICGEAGTTRDSGWIKTLCDEHEAKRQEWKQTRWENSKR